MRTGRTTLRRAVVLVAGGAAAFFVGVSPASADNGPHVSNAITQATTGVTLAQMGATRCASCHRAHTAKSAYLLAADSQESLCFSCHGDGGTGSTLNVQSGVAYTAPDGSKTAAGALRGGGFEQAMLGATEVSKEIYQNGTRWSARNQQIPALSAPEPATSSHLGGPNTMWGNGAFSDTANPGKVTTADTKLECGSCHDPHGNKMYRILKPVPVGSGVTTGVPITDTSNKVYTTTNYWIAGDPNVPAAERTTTALGATSYTDPTPVAKTVATPVSPYIANVNAWCTTCHTRYLAKSGSWSNSSGDAVFTYRHTSDHVAGEASNRNCVQCHVAHGSNATMSAESSVEWPGGAAKSSDSRLLRVDERGVCTTCHNL